MFDKYEKHGAYHWAWYDDPNYAWYKECVDRCVKFCKGSTIDAGCGDGVLLDKIEYTTLGFDNSTSALTICRTKGLHATYGDLNTQKPILVGEWDYLASLNTVEHLKSPKGLVELVRSVRKGAIIITDKPTGHTGRYHEHEYTKEELLDLFKEFKPKYFEINSTEHGKPITFHGLEITK